MKKEPSVTISLLTWNGERYLPWLLKSIKEQKYTNFELLVLDNASTDNSVDIVRDVYPEARVIKQKKNIGFAKGHNLLVNWSSSDYVLFLNQDIILEPEYIYDLVEFLESNKKSASAMGKLLYWDFEEGNKTKIIDSFGLEVYRNRHIVDSYQGKNDFKIGNKEIFGPTGAAPIYRRKALDTIAILSDDGQHQQYFDEDFFAYKEDIDLAWRLRLLAWEHWLVPSAVGYHHRTISSRKAKERRKHSVLANKLSYRNHLMVLYKNSFYKNLFRDFFQIKWYEFKKFMYLLIFEPKTLGGLGEYIKSIPKLSKKRRYIMKHRNIEADDIYKWFK